MRAAPGSLTPSDSAAVAAAPAAAVQPRAAYTVGFLTLVSVFNYLDRSLLGLMLPLVQADLRISDSMLGLISGLAFAIFYATLNLPIANLADRYNRRNIVAGGFALWSAATVLSGYAANALQMALCRFAMGAGEACGLAPSQSMITDVVRPAKRPFALSVLSTASAIDALVFLPIAAVVAQLYGWRTAFQLAGLVGLVLAAVFLLSVPEPERRADKGPLLAPPLSMRQSIALLLAIPAFRSILVGVTFMGAALYANGSWISSMLVRVHGMSIAEIGLFVTPARGVLGIAGILIVGRLTGKLVERDRRWQLWMPALTALGIVPAYFAFLLSDFTPVWIAGLLVAASLQTAFQGPVFAATIALAPDNVRTMAVGMKVFFAGMFGLILGPLFVGVSNDLLAPVFGRESIRYSMLSMAACSAIGGLFFLRAGRQAERDR